LAIKEFFLDADLLQLGKRVAAVSVRACVRESVFVCV
jgi:hypothetical protein